MTVNDVEVKYGPDKTLELQPIDTFRVSSGPFVYRGLFTPSTLRLIQRLSNILVVLVPNLGQERLGYRVGDPVLLQWNVCTADIGD